MYFDGTGVEVENNVQVATSEFLIPRTQNHRAAQRPPSVLPRLRAGVPRQLEGSPAFLKYTGRISRPLVAD